MRTKIILAAFVLFITVNAFSQIPNVIWTESYGGTQNDYGECARQTADGGFILAGHTSSFGGGNQDIYLVKTNSSGQQEWDHMFGNVFEDMGFSVVQSSDNGYVVVGHQMMEIVGYGVIMAKTDESGNALWERNYGGRLSDFGRCVKETSDNGFIISGNTLIEGPNNDYNAFLIKTDSEGIAEWESDFGGDSDEMANCVIQTSDGGYAITGYKVTTTNGIKDVYIAKTDANGTMLWENNFGGDDNDQGYEILQTNDGGFLIAGYTASFGTGDASFYVVKTDANGVEMWQTTYGGEGYDQGLCMVEAQDGGYIIGGKTTSYGVQGSDVLLIKIDESGEQLWYTTFGGVYNQQCNSLAQTSDGGYIVGGKTGYWSADDAWMARLDDGAAPTGLEVTLTPVSLPIQIPANGGSFDFNIDISNTGTSAQNIDIWTMVTLPSGDEYGPIINFPDFTVNPGWSGDRDRVQNVPAGAPAGNYTYDAYIGIHPSSIWAEDHFDFEKLAVGDCGAAISDWYSWGESFEDISSSETASQPEKTTILSAYPNPFNPATTLSYVLPEAGHVTLSIYDVNGREAAKLAEGFVPAGEHSMTFDGGGLPSGMYFARLEAGDFTQTQKLLLVK